MLVAGCIIFSLAAGGGGCGGCSLLILGVEAHADSAEDAAIMIDNLFMSLSKVVIFTKIAI